MGQLPGGYLIETARCWTAKVLYILLNIPGLSQHCFLGSSLPALIELNLLQGMQPEKYNVLGM